MSFDRKQRFSIRKYSVGVASVLIGTVLAGTTIAAADTEVKVDEASSSSTSVASESLVEEAAPVAETEKVATYTAEPAIPSPSLTPVEKNEEAVASEKTTEAPAKEVAEVEKKANVVEAKVEEAKKEAKVDTKVEEAKKESQSAPTVEEAESKAVVSEKAKVEASEAVEDKASETAAPSVKDKIVVDKKVPGLDLENATVNPNGGYDIQLTKEAQEKFRASLEAYIARRRNYNRRGSFRAAGDATSTDPDYEFKKVMTPVLPGFYADKASIEALVVDPTNIDDYVFNVWYKKLGYVTYVDEQGNYITPAGEVTSKQEESARKQYANDPSDPTRAWFTNVPSVPTGWEIKPGQSIYGYDETRKTVNPNHKDDLDAIGRDTKIVITKQIQKAIIKYVNEKGNTELSRDLVSGKSGELINYSTNDKISSYRRQGYELVSDGFSDAADKNFDSDTKVDQEFTVTLRERIEPIDPDKPKPNPDQPVDPKDPDTPKWPDPVKDVVNKDDVTRTVKYVYEDGSKAKDDVTETLHFKRFAYVNLVTGHIDYREWTTSDDTFNAVKSPVITGYTANKLVVPEVKGVKAGAEDIVEVVTYVKDAQKAIIKYVNEKGNVELDRDVVNGKSGEAIDYSTDGKISAFKRKGYELVNDGFTNSVNKKYDFDAKVDQEFFVTLRERIEPIDPDKPKPNPDQPVDPKDPDTPKWPDPVKDVVNKDDVTRTIHYVYEDGSKAKDDVTETLHFKRFAYVNLVTGHVDYRPWTSEDTTFDTVLTPKIQGYTADKDVVPAVTGVEATAPDFEVTVTYVRDAQKAIIKYVNAKGNTELSRDQVVGKSGEAIDYSTADKIAAYKRKGYELVSDGFTSAANKNFDFDKAFDQEFTVTLRERIEPIDPDKPKPNPDQPVDPKDPDTPKWPDPVKDVVNKDDVTRTVKYVYEDGSKAKDDVTETLHFKRFAYVNLVTGHIDYREWTTSDDTFDAVKSPVISGYTANKLVVPEVKGVKAGAKDVVEVVTYVKDAQKAIIKYVNEKGTAELGRDQVVGKSGEAIPYSTADKIAAYKRKGYELVSDGFTSAANKNFDFDAKVDQEFTVVVRERIVPVGPNDPNPTPDTPYDPTDPKTPNWPKTVDKIQPRRITGTRTVYYYVEDGDGVPVPKPVRERVVFERIVLVNLVTGEMTPQAWKFVSATPIEDDAANRPAVRTRRALTDAIAPRGVEASLASDTPRFRARSARLEDEETEVTALAADVSSNSEAVLPPIPSPVVPGHYTLVKEIESTTIDPDGTLNYKFDVYYKKLGRIQLVDKDGKVLSEVVYKNNLTDASRADVTPVPEIPAAYKIKDGQKVFGYDTTAGTVDPNDPADPNAIGRNTTIVVEQKSVARQETKVVTETIFYKDALTGEVLAPEHKDKVTFHREVVVNPVTNEVLSTGEWTAENADTTFDAVTSPVLEGYTANPLVVEEVTGLTAESKDVVATVLYTKKPAPTPEPKPQPQPQPQPQPRPQPQPEPVKPEPEKPQPVKQEPAKPEAPVTPQAPALPETGEDQSVSAALFGAALGMVGLAGLAKRKKQED